MKWYEPYAEHMRDDVSVLDVEELPDAVRIRYRTESCGEAYPEGFEMLLGNDRSLRMHVYDTFKPYTDLMLEADVVIDGSNVVLKCRQCSSHQTVYTPNYVQNALAQEAQHLTQTKYAKPFHATAAYLKDLMRFYVADRDFHVVFQ